MIPLGDGLDGAVYGVNLFPDSPSSRKKQLITWLKCIQVIAKSASHSSLQDLCSLKVIELMGDDPDPVRKVAEAVIGIKRKRTYDFDLPRLVSEALKSLNRT